jgi:hypothetical protein
MEAIGGVGGHYGTGNQRQAGDQGGQRVLACIHLSVAR